MLKLLVLAAQSTTNILYKIIPGLNAPEKVSPSGDMSHYRTGIPKLNQALALAHIMAFHSVHEGIAASTEAQMADEGLARSLRGTLLHHLNLSNYLNEEQLKKYVPLKLEENWFKLDIQNPRPQDDPKASLAFACARTAFFVRCAHMMGWLNEEQHLSLLFLNSERASDCFASWHEFGISYAQGRQQWIKYGRADIFGRHITIEDINTIMALPNHPWASMPWPPTAS